MLDFKKNNNIMPLYMQVADWIRENIYAGVWKAGENIPSEYQLTDILRISRGTIKKAVETLAAQGLVLKVQGKGTFVTNSNVSYSLGTNGHGYLSISESLDIAGVNYKTEVIKACFIKTTESIARKLQIQEDKVFYLERIRIINNVRAIFMENWINPVLCPNMGMYDFNKETLFPVIERLSGHKIKFIKGNYMARSIGGKRGNLLGIDERTPILYGEQLAHLDNDVPVDLGVIWLRSDQYCFNLTLYR